MQQRSLLPFMHGAALYVEGVLGRPGDELIETVRAMASYDFAMLAYGFRPKLSTHSAAMTAAGLLCIAEHLKSSGGGPLPESGTLPPECDVKALERDAGVLGTLIKPLTQDDVARALAHFQQAAQTYGIDLGQSLAQEMAALSNLAPGPEAKQPLRVINQDFVAGGGVGCPVAQQVEQSH